MSGNILTYLTQADIRDARAEINGKILTRPALLVSDGTALVYAADVDIGQTDPLRNVPVAAGNKDLLYAEAGSACLLRRSANGQYQIVGFSKEMPGSYVRIPVSISSGAFGPTETLGLTSRPLALDELKDYGGGFGVIALGAVAIFQNGILIRIA